LASASIVDGWVKLHDGPRLVEAGSAVLLSVMAGDQVGKIAFNFCDSRQL